MISTQTGRDHDSPDNWNHHSAEILIFEHLSEDIFDVAEERLATKYPDRNVILLNTKVQVITWEANQMMHTKIVVTGDSYFSHKR